MRQDEVTPPDTATDRQVLVPLGTGVWGPESGVASTRADLAICRDILGATPSLTTPYEVLTVEEEISVGGCATSSIVIFVAMVVGVDGRLC